MGKGIQLAIATISLFVGLTWFLSSQAGGEGSFAYYEDVGSFLANGTSGSQDATTRDGSEPGSERRGLRVHGYVVEASIRKELAEGYVDFAIQDRGDDGASESLRVRYLGIDVPDVFADGAEVVVEGHLESGTFLAERVLAKCPSKYETEVPGETQT